MQEITIEDFNRTDQRFKEFIRAKNKTIKTYIALPLLKNNLSDGDEMISCKICSAECRCPVKIRESIENRFEGRTKFICSNCMFNRLRKKNRHDIIVIDGH